MYVHNNAADNLNLVAENTVANFNVPSQTAKRIQIDGYLSSSNASPSKIWDQAVFSSDSDFNISYVAGSATYTNNVFTGGTALPDTVATTGATLGYDKLDGKVPGCFKYSGYVIFKVKATTASFDIQKTVRVNGATDKTFKENVSVNPGNKVDYQIYFKNTGGTQLKDVVIKDALPTGAKYVAGSTYLHTSDGTKQVADGIIAGGIVIGGYMPDGDAYIKFTAEIASNDNLPACGQNTLTNTATVVTANGNKQDTATVTVTKTCKNEKNITCNKLSVEQLSKNSARLATDYSVSDATFKQITYTITDPNGKIDTKTSTGKTMDYNFNSIGKYNIQATVNASADGKDIAATGDSCKSTIEVSSDTITPTELPTTGIDNPAIAIAGLGSIVTAIGYYIASRRSL